MTGLSDGRAFRYESDAFRACPGRLVRFDVSSGKEETLPSWDGAREKVKTTPAAFSTVAT